MNVYMVSSNIVWNEYFSSFFFYLFIPSHKITLLLMRKNSYAETQLHFSALLHTYIYMYIRPLPFSSSFFFISFLILSFIFFFPSSYFWHEDKACMNVYFMCMYACVLV